MQREVVGEMRGRKIVLMDSVALIGPEEDGQVVVSASHGGRSAAEYAGRQRPFAVFFNDAGIGKEGAGIAGLRLLEGAGVAAGAVGHLSARIGDARDTWESGVIAHVNRPAREAGFQPGAPLRRAIEEVLGRWPT